MEHILKTSLVVHQWILYTKISELCTLIYVFEKALHPQYVNECEERRKYHSLTVRRRNKQAASLFGTSTITQTTASKAKEGPLVCFTGCRPGCTESFDTSHRTIPAVKSWGLHRAWTGDACVWRTCKISLLGSGVCRENSV